MIHNIVSRKATVEDIPKLWCEVQDKVIPGKTTLHFFSRDSSLGPQDMYMLHLVSTHHPITFESDLSFDPDLPRDVMGYTLLAGFEPRDSRREGSDWPTQNENWSDVSA